MVPLMIYGMFSMRNVTVRFIKNKDTTRLSWVVYTIHN